MAQRGTTLTSLRSNNVENEAVGPRGKGAMVPNNRVTRRTAMSEIGNKQGNALQPFGNRTLKNVAPLKQEIKKPSRITKQKATTNLQKISEPSSRITRRSAEKVEDKPVESMEQDVTQKIEDVEMEDLEQVPVATSTAQIENIDQDDVENPQLVVEYVNEIYAYMRYLEDKQSISEEYLSHVKSTIMPKMRAVLVDWLIQVHQQFNLLQETLYLTIAVLDRFLQVHASKVERKQLQLVGVAAMFIASKYEEMYAPEIGDFVYITDRAYTESQIREMEMRILDTLGFDLGRPLPLHFLRRNSKAGNVDALTHTMAKYIMELTLVEYKMAHWKPSLVAASALALSLKVLDQDQKSLSQLWSPTLVHYTSYKLTEISDTVAKLATLVLTTSRAPENSKLLAVRKKYEDKKMSRISKTIELTGDSMEQLAAGNFL